MSVSSRATSRPGRIVCPACGSGELRLRGAGLAGYDCCGRDVDGAVLRVLEQVVALPDALGAHACECGHPEMRRRLMGCFTARRAARRSSPLRPFHDGVRHSKLRHPNRQPDESPWNSFPTRAGIYVMEEIERR